ncbi:recombinase family protein [Carnobacterium maltaromaticum]|uniref:recombinase family protein n=1 Tax=Carnobacterium maltaromaticum TaxID=2751 RepID=UPI00191BAFDE|nr:recombinase family protein [Carnobacterium maltaromaticum]CAD5902934.1 Resolvase, N-terminal domain protein [Carnobacterium maltaromaticum]
MYLAYLRVSAADQNLARQEAAIQSWKEKNKIPDEELKIFEEKVSGKDIKNRLQLQELLSFVRERDTVVVQSLDRLGRNSKDIKDLLQLIQSKSASIEILDLPSFQGVTDSALKDLLTNLVIEVFSYVAESEREKIRERQQQGIKIAKENGRFKGRQIQYGPDSIGKNKVIYDTIVNGINSGDTIAAIANNAGVTRKTIYAIKNRLSL